MYNSCSWCSSDTKETLQKKESLKEILERERERERKKKTRDMHQFRIQLRTGEFSAVCEVLRNCSLSG